MKYNKGKFYLVILIFIVPVALSWLTYFNYHHFHFKTNNHGALLDPPIQVSDIFNQEAKQWQIVYAPSHCEDAQSEKTMFVLHQLHIALGENQQRVSLTLLVDQTCQLNQTHDFRKIVLTTEQQNQFQSKLKQDTAMNKIYLIDPLYNLFMYYPATTNPKNIFEDIKIVLGASQIG